MSTLTNDPHSLSMTTAARWRMAPGSTFEVTVKARPGSVRVAGSIGLAEGLVRVDPDGQIRISVTIDTAGLGIHGTRRDARLLSLRLPGLTDNSVVRFTSTTVTDRGAGRLHLAGLLEAGAKRVPLEFEAQVTRTGGTLELVATTVVAHRRLGLTWIPAGPLKAPTELVVRARLIPHTGDGREARAPARSPRPRRLNSRYRFMTGRTRV